ncbi:MAG: hypothetical protein M3380_16250 [Chloroflexota bacterium]|nr:hypothetical protein [Chloroflexota bacterium]
MERLQNLAATPDEQATYALRLLEKERDVDVLLAALAVIAEREDPMLRPALLRRYAYCDTNGVRRDPGGTVRIAILRALRPIALPEDVALFKRAVSTYEFLYGEATGDLRAEGLLALDDADAVLAGYHCVRLLDDPYTSVMSGEPASTAVRVLASQKQLLPLYAYVMREAERVPDVVAESLRSLASIPESLLPAVVEKYRESENEIVLLGLFDLLLAHDARSAYIDFILDFLRTTERYNVYRYLLIVLITGRDEAVIRQLEALAATEQDRYKQEIWREARALR